MEKDKGNKPAGQIEATASKVLPIPERYALLWEHCLNVGIRGSDDLRKELGLDEVNFRHIASSAHAEPRRCFIYRVLGVVFYQMLTGELPVGKFGPPSSKVQIDVRLDEIVLRALEKQPELRYQQASALKTQVETIVTTPRALKVPDPSPPLTRTEPSHAPINRYLVPILRWLGVAFTVFVLTVLCGAFITYRILPKVYVATAQIQVLPRGSTSQNGSPTSLEPTEFQSEFEIMQSPGVLEPIIKDLGLDKTWALRMEKSRLDALSPLDALAYMQKILRIDVKRGTNIIEISASSEVPQEAADIANALADHYKVLRDLVADQRNNRGVESLRDQIAQQQKVVDDLKKAADQEANPALIPNQNARRDLEGQQSLLNALNLRLEQVIVDSQLQQSPVRIVSRASPPVYPSKPNNAVNLVISMIAGFLLSIVAASGVEFAFWIASSKGRNT